MIRHSQLTEPRLMRIALVVPLAVLLVALHKMAAPVFVALLLFSMAIAFYRPVAFIYLLSASTLFAPELPVAGGISPNVLLISGLALAVLGRMTLSENWILPHSSTQVSSFCSESSVSSRYSSRSCTSMSRQSHSEVCILLSGFHTSYCPF